VRDEALARAVRQTLALEARVAEEIQTARFEAERSRIALIRDAAHQRQTEIRVYVAEAIEAEAVERKSPKRDVERLLNDLDERIEAGDYDDTLETAPIGELVARICADLGVSPDWDLWDDRKWALDHLKAIALEDIGAERWPRTAAEHSPPELHAEPPPDWRGSG